MHRLSPLVTALSLAACLSTAASQAAAQATPASAAAMTKPAMAKPAVTADAAATAPLAAAIGGAWRDPKNVARDQYRHPAQTLAFFGVAPGSTLIEITPGSGWYSEILAPYLGGSGKYLAALPDPMAVPAGASRDGRQRSNAALQAKFAADAAHYGRAEIVGYDPAKPVFGTAGTADTVLTFRNVHNWRMVGQAEGMFRGFFAVLKPGGTLGVVEHRAKADVAADDRSGYVGEAQVIAMAEAAGFKLDGKSEVNANPKDTKDYVNGVWTLPPVNDHDAAADGTKYRAIGESDRMTLRFVKPR